MKRRYLLQYGTLTTASLAFAACSKGVNQAKPVAFGQPEQKEINIGFVSSISCLPLVIAQNKGFFKEQGLTVKLVKFPTSEALQAGLSKGKIDVAQTHFALPLWSHINKDKSPLVALMGMTLNGNSMGMSKKAWDGGMRPHYKFNYRREFSDLYSSYLHGWKEPPIFAIDHLASMSHYLARYWLGSMQIDPNKSFKFQVVNDKNLLTGLQSGKIDAYALEESTNQQLIKDKSGFTAYVDRDIWRGHPDKILATTENWAKTKPITAKAVVASVLAACQFCDLERLRQEEEKTPITLAQQLAKTDYLDGSDAKSLKLLLTGTYQYDRLEVKSPTIDPKSPPTVPSIPDFQIFHFVDKLDYLQDPNNANYLWHSDAVWVLTQMVRWNQLNLFEYPKDADKLIAAAYPQDVFKEVAKAVGLNLPNDTIKKQGDKAFIDKLVFDASQPVEYINGFDLRTNRPVVFGFA
jgi:nitrate/nitrite transport system substrate-binding protein